MLTPSLQSPVAWPRQAKRWVAVSFDAVACVLTVWLVTALRLEDWHLPTWQETVAGLLSAAILLPAMAWQGQYRLVHRYIGWPAIVGLSRALVLHGVVFMVLTSLLRLPGIPRTVGLMQPVLLALVLGAARFGVRQLWGVARRAPLAPPATGRRLLIYGAGNAGQQMAHSARRLNTTETIGFIDADPSLHGRSIMGLTVFSPAQLEAVCAEHRVTDVILAMPSATDARRRELIASLLPLKLRVRTLPDLSALMSDRVSLSDAQEVRVEDLLGRQPVAPDARLMALHTRGRVVLVTGAGGSIGSELCRQIAMQSPSQLLLLDTSEYALYTVHQALLSMAEADSASPDQATAQTRIVPLLGSVCDAERMDHILRVWQPHTVYHAAAYKHVPLVEHNVAQGVANNVLGTLTLAQAIIRHRVPHLVLISTDKAVRPTNVMGASKRLAEMVLQALAPQAPHTTLTMVRFGNVLNSSGSVVPLFKQQIQAGGPVTVTHPEITRFFMTIAEASQLVIQAGAMASSGDVFVLDMGEPVQIVTLARRMIELSGHNVRDAQHPHGSIEIIFTGLRPGEKLYEELLIGDNPQPTQHPRILRAQEAFWPWDDLAPHLDSLRQAVAANDVTAIRQLLQMVVSGYQPSSGIVDWTQPDDAPPPHR